MGQKADVMPVLRNFNREHAKPLGQRPHDMSKKDAHKLFFDDTPFALVGEEE
jgi:hypothetical protein